MSSISSKQATRFLLSYLKKHSGSITLGLLFLIGVDAVQLIIPKIIQNTLDHLSNNSFSTDLILKRSLLIIFLAAAMVIFRFLWRFFIVRPSRKIEQEMRQDMFAHLEKLSSTYFNKTKTGDLMALFINDLNSIRMASGMALIGLVDAIFLSTMSLFFMFSINPRLTLYTIIPLPLIILILTKTGKIIQKKHLDVQKSFDAISSHTQESISGVRVLKSFVQEQHENNRFTTLCNHYAKANLSLVKIWGFLFPSITLLGSLSLSILLFFGSKLVILQELTIGQFVSFTFYINLLVWPMIATGWVFNMIQRGIASSKRVLELMETKSDVWVHPAKSTDDPIKGKIEIRNLSFSYASDSKRVLSDISFTIERGSSLGIIGKPGSGKSTLASLLFHLYSVDQGCIFIDDTDVNHIKLPILRSSISYVPQDSSLFSDTIKENIGFGVKYDITQDNIESAAKNAAVHKDIMSFSHGYSTQIGERGITLSGGQKQRLAIARAILTDSPILILDDALSAVDSATEKQILLSIDDIIRKRTTIMIAHRISTVKNCDSIIVLSEGKITERGSHSELLELDGFYARLYNLQKIRETAQ